MSNTRKITVFTSKGKKQKLDTNVSTWGELRNLIEEDYDLDNLQATESVNKTTLNHVDSKLPETDFVLFLRPIRTKSGQDYSNMSFRELRQLIKSDDNLKDFLNDFKSGKNWTQLGTEDLRKGVTAYYNKSNDSEVVTEVNNQEMTKDSLISTIMNALDNLSDFVDCQDDLDEITDKISNLCEVNEDDEEDEELRKIAEEIENGFFD